MEANAVVMDAPESADHETNEYAAEMERHMPQGNEPTDQELRADYLLEKMAEEQEKLDHLNEFTERRIQMIRDHAEIEGLRIKRRMDWLESKVRMCVPYDAREFQSAYGKKSLKLPHGQLGYRSSKETVEIRDPAKALEFARANRIDIKVDEKVNKTPLHEWVKKSGEVPDLEECGFEIMPATDSFFVKVG